MRLGRRTSRWIIVVTTDHHGLRRPIFVQFLLLLSSLPSTVGMTDRHTHNGSSSVYIQKLLNSWNLGTGTTSLIFMTNQQNGPSWLRWFVTHSITSHSVRIPHLPTAATLLCHLRTVTSTTNHHKLRRWYFSLFLAQKPQHSSFRQISCKSRET